MAQTAVEWLKEKLVNMYNDTDMMHPIRVLEFIEQAKAMEKEQIEKAYIECAEEAKKILKEELKDLLVLQNPYGKL